MNKQVGKLCVVITNVVLGKTGRPEADLSQSQCRYVQIDNCGYGCGMCVQKAQKCNAGEYVAGLRFMAANSHGLYDFRLLCCKGR